MENEGKEKRSTLERLEIADRLVGLGVTLVIGGLTVWSLVRGTQAFSRIRQAYEAGRDLGEILAEAFPELSHDEREELHRDIRRMEGRGD